MDLFIMEYPSGELQVEDETGYVYAIATEIEPDVFVVLNPMLDPSLDEEMREWLEDDCFTGREVVDALRRAGYDARPGWLE